MREGIAGLRNEIMLNAILLFESNFWWKNLDSNGVSYTRLGQ